MKNQFQYNEAPAPAPVRVEQVIAEVPGGGLLKDAGYDVIETTPVGRASDGKYQVIKVARVKTKYNGSGATIEVEKGHGLVKGEFLMAANGGIAKTISSINTGAADKDTITLDADMTGVTIEAGEYLYQAKAAADGSASHAEPIVKPIGYAGAGHHTAENGIVAFAGNGDTPIKVVVIGTVRKETCMFGAEIEGMLKGIHRV